MIKTSATAVDSSVPWIMSCARRTVDLLGKELCIWVTLTSAANSIYVLQAFLSMGWYLLAVNNVKADLQFAATRELLVFTVLLYFCFELHNQVRAHSCEAAWCHVKWVIGQHPTLATCAKHPTFHYIYIPCCCRHLCSARLCHFHTPAFHIGFSWFRSFLVLMCLLQYVRLCHAHPGRIHMML
jgi:hypothetical protein